MEKFKVNKKKLQSLQVIAKTNQMNDSSDEQGGLLAFLNCIKQP